MPDRAVRSFLKVAEEYEKRGLFSQALAIYKKVYKIQPQDADISLKLADLYSQQGFQSDAKDEYLKTAARFIQEKKFQEAIHVYEKVCRLDREDLGAEEGAGRTSTGSRATSTPPWSSSARSPPSGRPRGISTRPRPSSRRPGASTRPTPRPSSAWSSSTSAGASRTRPSSSSRRASATSPRTSP